MKFEDRVQGLAWKALMGSFNMGLEDAFKGNKYKDFIWVMPKSEKNCKVCKNLHGVTIYSANIGEIYPCHPGCTCVIMPKGV